MPRTLPILLLAVLACSGGEEAPLPDVTWRIDSVPVLRIADEPVDTLIKIGYVSGLAALPDGGVVVGDRDQHRLTFFDSTGTITHTVGREGSGPGEYEYLVHMWRCGDSIVVQDARHKLHNVYDIEGNYVRQFPTTAPEGARFPSAYASACNASGTWIHYGWDNSPRQLEYTRIRGEVPFWFRGNDGQPSLLLDDRPGSERLAGPNGDGPHPLGKEAVIAIGRDRAYIGTADSFAIEVLGMDGQPVDTILRTGDLLRVTPEDQARWYLLDTLGKSPDRVASNMRGWERFQFPPTVPAYTAFLVDDEDNLWVRMFPRSTEDLVRWIVFTPTGEHLAEIDLPETLRVYTVEAGYVTGVETDLTTGVQSVVRYRVRRDG
jgi:hypothetical protein